MYLPKGYRIQLAAYEQMINGAVARYRMNAQRLIVLKGDNKLQETATTLFKECLPLNSRGFKVF
jgi:hypothetical protein